MTVNSYRMTAGTLTLGEGDDALQIAAQLTNCVLTPSENVKTDDAIDVLSGEQIAEEVATVTITWVLSGKLLQDLTAAHVIDWSYDLDGLTEVPFVFSPNNASGRGSKGICYPFPITLGGDVKTRPQSDFSWRCKGGADAPIFGVFASDDVTEDA